MIREAQFPILLVGHGVHTSRTGAAVKELADLMACPVIQTSGGTSFIAGLEDRTFAYGFSPSAVEAVVKSDLCVALGTELGEPVHYGKTRHWAENNLFPAPSSASRCTTARRGTGRRTTPPASGSTSSRTRWRSA